jgi:type III secretion system FlhB-like substrate exporter
VPHHLLHCKTSVKKLPHRKFSAAVGLSYDDRRRSVPIVSCKGTGLIADRIRQIAARHGIPVIEDRRLVDALIEIEEDAEIPREVFEAVAGIIAALAMRS